MRRQRNMAQMKEQNRTPEKELSDARIARCRVIRMLRYLTEYGKSIREEVKATLSEIKKNPQGTNSEGKEDRIQINDLEHKEEINIQQEQNEETRTQKNEESLRKFWDISKRTNIQIIGVPEEEQKIENLFEKNSKRKLP